MTDFQHTNGHPSPYCGRLDQHNAHEWIGHDWDGHPAARIIRGCPGAPLIEGGNPAHDNDELVEPLGPRARALAKKNSDYTEGETC